jgi:hypothetical protein
MQKFSLNRLRGWLMRLPAPCLRYSSFLVLAILVTWVTTAFGQEKPGVPNPSSVPTAKKSPDTKKQTPSTESASASEQTKVEDKWEDKDSPELIRKREEWFYKQRSSVNGHIPAGARFKAFQHMQRMMQAEGKLVRRPDGSYSEVAPQSLLSPLGAVTSAWASIGPTPTTGGFFSPVTGRITTIAVDPSDITGNTVLVGGAMGGIWRSTDAGQSWTAVGDQNASLAMGSIAFAPSNHSVVYAGTGESESVAFDIYYGAGVLKSTDGGLHWTQTCTVASATCPFIGPYDDITPFGFFTLGGTRITYIAVNPSNPQMVLVGAQTQFSQGPTEGVYCSDNGGTTWSNILPDQLSSFVGFASSSVAYAALGNPFGSSPNAPNGNGIYKATGIGSTCSTIQFSRLTTATLPPQSSMGRIDLGIAPSDPSGNTVYASIADATTSSTTNLGVYATTNGGTNWALTSAPDVCQHQCWYDNVVKVDPNNPSIAFFGGGAVRDANGNFSWVVRTENGGTTWSSVIPNLPSGSSGLPHVDNHAIAFVKLSTGKVRMYLGNDGGIWRTDDAEASTITWTNLNNPSLTLTQFYPSISINASSPAFSFGGTQDNASQNYQGGVSWVDNQLCGDGASTAVDFAIPSTVYIGCATGAPINASYQNGAIGTFSAATNGINPNDGSSFIPPIVVDPSVGNVLYFGTTNLYQSADAAVTWTLIAGVLGSTSNDFISAIAVAPTNSSVVYTGAFSGRVFIFTNVTLGNFANWNEITRTLPPRAVTAIAVDSADATGNTAYVAFSGFSFVNPSFGVNDPTGHIFRTTDGGTTWKDVSCSVMVCTTPAAADLPNIPVNDVLIDPDIPGTIYAATDLGVFVGNCTTAPCTWSALGTGLPRVVVLSLRLHEPSRTLRAATHGRGAWDIDLNNFTFSGPHISSLTPTSANASGSSFTLTVNGSGLAGGTVQWNGSATNILTTQVSDAKLTASIAASLLSLAGTPKITVANGTQTSNALVFSVLAGTPTITSITPSSTPVQTPAPATNVTIQINGTNFSSSAKVLFNGASRAITIAAPTAGCPVPTCLAATLPAALLGPFGSTNDIAVLNMPPGGGQSKPLTFKVVAPPPPNDNFANATNITTLSFNDVQDSSGATTESTDPTPPCARQFTTAQGNTGGHPNGAYNTTWYKFTPIFSANLDVDTGSLNGLERNNSSYDTVLSIWTGSSGSLVNIACNDDIAPGNILSQISSFPLTAGTTYYIMVSSFGPPDPNPIALGGKSAFNFYYNGGSTPVPTITSISPSSANSGDPAFTLNVSGSGFLNGATVFFNSNPEVTTFVSSTQLKATIPTSDIPLPATVQVSVQNAQPACCFSNVLNFTINLGVYPVPTLSAINPTSAVAGSVGFTMVAFGSNFAPAAVLQLNGVAMPTTVNNSGAITASILASAIASPGTAQVTIFNPAPGGGASPPRPFTLTQPTVVPTISSLSPATGVSGTSFILTVTGTGFQQGANLFFNNLYYSGTFSSSTQVSVSFPLFGVAPGTYALYVVDPPPAGTSAPVNFTVTPPPVPTITSINPGSGPSGSSTPITITGTGFQQGATVSFSGTNYGTTLSSSTQLATVLQLTGVAAGTYPLSVVDPAPYGSSTPFNFNVTDFSITSSGTTTQTVAAGQPATFTNAISVGAQNGFSAQVNLSCSLPVAATATTCTVTPNMFASGSGMATVTVTTMTRRGLTPPLWPRMRFISRPQFLPILLLMILSSALLLRLSRTRRQRFAGALPLVGLLLFLMLQAIGCGGGSSTPPPPTGTPAGTYTVTVTGTSGATTHTTTLMLTVN